MTNWKSIHDKAVSLAKTYLRSEAELLDVLQAVDRERVYLELGYASLFGYCVEALKLSESQSYSFIRVARKALEVPELKQAVESGRLNVNAAKRIASVVTPQNQALWIEMASILKQRALEVEVAKANPQASVPERVKPVAQDRMELRCGISEKLSTELTQVKDLMAQRTGKPVTLEDALQAMTALYLEKHDPVRKAQRARTPRRVARTAPAIKGTKRTPIPAEIRHQVHLRDQGQCTQTMLSGSRCPTKRWLNLHHLTPIAHGGEHSARNLTTLCSAHHLHHHQKATGAG